MESYFEWNSNKNLKDTNLAIIHMNNRSSYIIQHKCYVYDDSENYSKFNGIDQACNQCAYEWNDVDT